MHQPNEPQRKRSTAGKLAIVLIALLTAVGMGATTVAADDHEEHDTKEIHVKESTLEDPECDRENPNQWHFIINQIDKGQTAPASIFVEWDNGQNATVLLSKLSGQGQKQTAHYNTTLHQDANVTDATAEIYEDWNGQFVLSHGPCGEENGEENVPCPELTVTAEAGPSNHLNWTAVEDADKYNIYKAVGDGPLLLIDMVDNATLSYDDEDVVQGQTYRYMVTVVIDGQESEDCDEVEVTAIPVFPTAIVATAAGLLGISAYAVIRKRS